MKTQFLSLVIGITVSALLTTDVKAQLIASNINNNISKLKVYAMEDKAAGEETKAPKADKAAARLMKADMRALKEFKQEFKDAQDVKWVNEKEVISAYFKRDDVQTFVVFDKKGNWMRNMSYYSEDKMPKDIRGVVKRSEFYDYKISGVQDIKEGDSQFFIVHLEDDKNYKQLCIYEGRYKVIKEYKKQVQ